MGPEVAPRLAAEGRRVVGVQAPACSSCRECRARLPHFCRAASSRYSGNEALTPAGFAPFMTLDADRLVGVTDEVGDEQVALIEPASVAMRGAPVAAGGWRCGLSRRVRVDWSDGGAVRSVEDRRFRRWHGHPGRAPHHDRRPGQPSHRRGEAPG
ncbi:MAG: hypothetical protein GY939_20825 [Actinomycetia bacterium]|nr:hypothetical protein [Actinomycetes bacterium]